MLSDVILQGDGPTVIPTLAKKITSELAEVTSVAGFISDVTADKRSFAGADVIKNLNFKDLHSSPAADHTGYRG